MVTVDVETLVTAKSFLASRSEHLVGCEFAYVRQDERLYYDLLSFDIEFVFGQPLRCRMLQQEWINRIKWIQINRNGEAPRSALTTDITMEYLRKVVASVCQFLAHRLFDRALSCQKAVQFLPKHDGTEGPRSDQSTYMRKLMLLRFVKCQDHPRFPIVDDVHIPTTRGESSRLRGKLL